MLNIPSSGPLSSQSHHLSLLTTHQPAAFPCLLTKLHPMGSHPYTYCLATLSCSDAERLKWQFVFPLCSHNPPSTRLQPSSLSAVNSPSYCSQKIEAKSMNSLLFSPPDLYSPARASSPSSSGYKGIEILPFPAKASPPQALANPWNLRVRLYRTKETSRM